MLRKLFGDRNTLKNFIVLMCLVMVAMLVAAHATRPLTSWVTLFVKTPVAVNCCESPARTDGFAGFT